jgi:hypothetical protein
MPEARERKRERERERERSSALENVRAQGMPGAG